MYKKSEKLKLIREGLESGKLLGQSIRDAGMKSYTTIDRWRKRPMIDRYFEACMNRMESRRNNAVVDSLFKQAISGNPTCIAIYLKFKMGWKDSPLIDQSQHSHLTIDWHKNGREVDKNRLLSALSPIRHPRTSGEVQGSGNGEKVGQDNISDKSSDSGGATKSE